MGYFRINKKHFFEWMNPFKQEEKFLLNIPLYLMFGVKEMLMFSNL